MKLAEFNNDHFDRGRSCLVEVCWRAAEGLLLNSWLPGSGWRVGLLRLFGAKIGSGVVIKPHVRVKFPWKLMVGNDTWIGESVWIDNLAQVAIGSNCCLSQGAFLCTGNHRWDKEKFDLMIGQIVIEDHCWIGAFSCVAPGVTMEAGSVLSLGSVATTRTPSWTISQGLPAAPMKTRRKHSGDT